MFYLFLLCCLPLIYGIVLLIVCSLGNKKRKIKLVKHDSSKYAILIPARYESQVIEKLLNSIKIQNQDMSNVYVIVEDKKDETCNITKKYKANLYVRKKPIRSRKGYALDECIKNILKKKHYDLYFIIDADNVLDSNFISNMIKSWESGYDVATGYRNILNPVNVVSCCSGILFCLLNSLVNKRKVKRKETIFLSGTGFYISGEIIEKLNGFPFNTLTEDYELSLYLAAHNISCTYNENAIFYDEQPTSMKVSIKQRTRWVKGFFEARKKRLKDVKDDIFISSGVTHIIFIIIGLFMLFIFSIISIFTKNYEYVFFALGPFVLYLVLFIVTLIILIKEKEHINLDKSQKIKILFFNPIFLFTFLICFVKSISTKNVIWDRIGHKGI